MPAFLNAVLLPGLLVASAPIIIHLINRNRFQEIEWGAYQLLLISFQKRARRMRMEELLILLLRILLLIAFVLALCRLVFKYEGLSWGDPLTSNVIVLDASYSMGRETDEGQLFDKARKRIVKLIEDLRKGEDISIVVIGRVPFRLNPKPVFEYESITKKLAELELEVEQADYVAGVDLAMRVLEETKNPLRRLYVFSDNQSFGWRSTQSSKWALLETALQSMSVDVSTFYIWEPVEEEPNLSVDGLRLQGVAVNTAEPARFVFSVKNHHHKAAPCSLVIEVDGRELDRRELTVDAKEVVEETFEWQFETAGNHVLEVRLDTDFIPGDNRGYMAVNVLDEVHILMVDEDQSGSFFESSTAYVMAALSPELSENLKSPFRCRRIHASAFDLEKLSDYRAVMLTNISSYSEKMVKGLEQYVDKGGGVLISCGVNSQPANMSDVLYREGEGLLPGRVVGFEQAKSDERPFSPFFPNGRSEVFPFLTSEEGQRLAEILVTSFLETEVTIDDRNRGVEVMAEFPGKKPFIAIRKFGRGKSILWTTALDFSWGNFPGQWVFVPLVNHLFLYLGSENQNENQVLQGDKIVTSIPIDSGDDEKIVNGDNFEDEPDQEEKEEGAILYVKRPDGEIEHVDAEVDGSYYSIDYAKTGLVGVYFVSPDLTFEDERTRAFAVNVNTSESNLTYIKPEFKKRLESGFNMKFFSGYNEFEKDKQESGTFDAWRWLIVAALAALLLESFFTSMITRVRDAPVEEERRVRWEN